MLPGTVRIQMGCYLVLCGYRWVVPGAVRIQSVQMGCYLYCDGTDGVVPGTVRVQMGWYLVL